jgi:hypothetical protein
MPKRASPEEIQRWRNAYWLLRKKYSNAEIAKRLGVDPGNLSALARGTKNKKGISKNPGADFIKHFWSIFPEVAESSGQPDQPYPNDGHPLPQAAEAKIRYINWDDPAMIRNELFSVYKKHDEHLRGEFTKLVDINQTAVNSVNKMAESNLILIQEVAFYRKKTNPAQENTKQTGPDHQNT